MDKLHVFGGLAFLLVFLGASFLIFGYVEVTLICWVLAVLFYCLNIIQK